MKVLTLFIGLLALTHGCDEEKVKMLKERVKALEDIVGKFCELNKLNTWYIVQYNNYIAIIF